MTAMTAIDLDLGLFPGEPLQPGDVVCYCYYQRSGQLRVCRSDTGVVGDGVVLWNDAEVSVDDIDIGRRTLSTIDDYNAYIFLLRRPEPAEAKALVATFLAKLDESLARKDEDKPASPREKWLVVERGTAARIAVARTRGEARKIAARSKLRGRPARVVPNPKVFVPYPLLSGSAPV